MCRILGFFKYLKADRSFRVKPLRVNIYIYAMFILQYMFYYVLCCDRSPPRPNPAGLRYSDEDICNNYNGAVSTDSTALTERAAELSESEVKS